MTLQLPPFRPALRFSAAPQSTPPQTTLPSTSSVEIDLLSESPQAKEGRLLLEMNGLVADLTANLDALTPVRPVQCHEDRLGEGGEIVNKNLQATLKHPNGRHFNVEIQYDWRDPARLACLEIRGTTAADPAPNAPHPSGRNLFLEHLRYNNWNPEVPADVSYHSSRQLYLKPRQYLRDETTFREPAQLKPVADFAEVLRKKLEALKV